MGGDLLKRTGQKQQRDILKRMALVLMASALCAVSTVDVRAEESTNFAVIEPASGEGGDRYTPQPQELDDPIEPVNRIIFGLNDIVDQVVFRPVALTYRTVLPPVVRIGVANALDNATSPITFANNILQGDIKEAETTAVRFFINSFAGFGGIQDVAGEAGWERRREDFGQTLAGWGVPPGPYIVAPLLGPSTPRHLVGRAVDVLANPWTWILWDASTIEALSPTLADAVVARESSLELLDGVRDNSPDYYSSLKNLYWQNRISEINNGEIVEEQLPDIPDLR